MGQPALRFHAYKDRFRVFQEELAALEKQDRKPEVNRLEPAKAEFLTLKRRYSLRIADVVTFFPEEEGIVYLEALIANPVEPSKKKARCPTRVRHPSPPSTVVRT
jgi:hypothetical protein